MPKNKINVQGLIIRVNQVDSEDFISLTDIAKQNTEEPRFTIQNWMRNVSTVRYLYEWEKIHNPDSNRVHLHTVLERATNNRFTMSPSKWIEMVNAIGITSKGGRYGGTFAHYDIALNFCYWLAPAFQVYIVKEFQRLKEEEAKRLNKEWNLRRELARSNYHIQTEAVRENLIPVIDWNTKKEGSRFASEADLINIAVFGMTAKEWRSQKPERKGNLRDNATELQLQVVANLESNNATLIEMGATRDERLEILTRRATKELGILSDRKRIS